MKWITSTDITQWADTRNAQALLPELVLRLIRATITNINNIRFPNGDAVHLTGWDGILDSDDTILNIPRGISLWECGVNSNPRTKADDDYNKRTNNPLGYDKASSTFVFVTPRLWDKAGEWARNKKQAGEWNNIVVITAVELEDWIYQHPAVALWLAEKIGRSTKHAYDLESFWDKWSTGKDFKLVPSILLGGRDSEREAIYEGVKYPSITIIQSMAQSESLAFAVACLLESPEKHKLLSNSIVVENEDTLEGLINEYENIVFIANVGHKNHTYANQKGHSIIYVASAAEVFHTTHAKIIHLPLLDREKFIESLVKSGINKEVANQLSRETVRNITILRRRLDLDYNMPNWAKPENIRDIIPAILIARWSETSEGDKELISYIAGESYESYIAKLHKWIKQDDSPIVTIDGKWRTYSPYEAFGYAAPHITSTDLDRYKDALHRIAADNDPDAQEKIASTELHFWKYKQKYSGWIKEGLFQSAIMISLMADQIDTHLKMSPPIWIDNIVSNILGNSSIEWWFSNKHILSLVAEASPKSYVEFIQKDLANDNSIIKRLFTPKESTDIFGPQENYVQVLFSLQSLLWSEDWLLPVSCILAELCGIKNDINLANKPIEALCQAYTIWSPQTYAGTKQRLQALETLSKKHPNQAFNLYYKLIYQWDSTTVFCTSPMRWRCYNYNKNKITNKDVHDSLHCICNLIVSICDYTEEQICKILKLAEQASLGQNNRQLLFNCVISRKSDFKGNFEITNTIRNVIYHHTIYSDAEWALSQEEIEKWKALLQELEPEDLLERYKWVFKEAYVEILEINRRKLGWEIAAEQVQKYKNQVILEIERDYGFDGVCSFAQIVGSPDTVGASYAYSANEKTYKKVLDVLLAKSDESILSFAKGFFRCYTYRNSVESIISTLNSLDIEKYSSIITIPLTVESSARHEIWTFIESLDKAIQEQYWKNVSIGYIYNDENGLYLLKKLIEYKRYDKAIDVIYHLNENVSIPADIIEEAIIGLISSPHITNIMSYELAKVVLYLDKLEDANIQNVCFIELILYRCLEHYGNADDIKLISEIMLNPHNMMEIIDKIYLSSDEDERINELQQIDERTKSYILQCHYILSNIRRTPYVDKDNNINEHELNNYINKLQELGLSKHKINGVNTVIGELLGNFPEIENYPPIPICDILEKHNNDYINNGFKTRIYNKRGVTMRPALEGGTLETIESQKYKKFADKIRFTHPIVCKIFDDLSKEYLDMAKAEDIKVKIEKMEF